MKEKSELLVVMLRHFGIGYESQHMYVSIKWNMDAYLLQFPESPGHSYQPQSSFHVHSPEHHHGQHQSQEPTGISNNPKPSNK